MPTDRNHPQPDLTTEPANPAQIVARGEQPEGAQGGYSEGFKEVLHPHEALGALDDLAQSERRYRRLFEAARDGILLLNIDTGCITDANPYLYELLGYPPDVLIGKELWEIGLFKDREASQAAFRRLHEFGYIRYEDLPLETLGGETREVEFVSNVYQENGHAVIQCNVRDITERKRTDRALEAALTREKHITEVLQYPLTLTVKEDAFPGILVAACYEPALKEAEVGGDFFDAFSFRTRKKSSGSRVLDTDMVALVVGDVVGKGLAAAALAGRVKDILRAFLRENHDPAQVLARLNDYLCDSVSSVGYSVEVDNLVSIKIPLLTLSIAVINTRTGATAMSSAGSESPAVLRASGPLERIETPGLLLGIMPDVSYVTQWLHLRPGDTILMATDGITEARRNSPPMGDAGKPTGIDLLGYERMLSIASRNLSATSVGAMSEAILNEARAFGEGFRDDVCLLLARRK